MRKGILVLSVLLVAFVLEGCYTPPKMKPAISQTVVTIQRYPAKKGADAKAKMEVYIDDTLTDFTVGDNQTVSVPINDGVHTIYVKVGKNESDTLNFTAAQKTVPFVASVESTGALFWKKTKVTLSRGNVIDDTGSMTDKPMQEQFTPQQ